MFLTDIMLSTIDCVTPSKCRLNLLIRSPSSADPTTTKEVCADIRSRKDSISSWLLVNYEIEKKSHF